LIEDLSRILATLVDTMNEDSRIEMHVENYMHVAEQAHQEAMIRKESYDE
jgi:hypothetical protein